MNKTKTTEVDIYMALLRQAKERPESQRSSREKQVLGFVRKGPSFNSIFRASKKIVRKNSSAKQLKHSCKLSSTSSK